MVMRILHEKGCAKAFLFFRGITKRTRKKGERPRDFTSFFQENAKKGPCVLRINSGGSVENCWSEALAGCQISGGDVSICPLRIIFSLGKKKKIFLFLFSRRPVGKNSSLRTCTWLNNNYFVLIESYQSFCGFLSVISL